MPSFKKDSKPTVRTLTQPSISTSDNIPESSSLLTLHVALPDEYSRSISLEVDPTTNDAPQEYSADVTKRIEKSAAVNIGKQTVWFDMMWCERDP